MSRGMFLWNPSTRRLKSIPRTSSYALFWEYLVYGLGYDVSTHDYKVVKFVSGRNADTETDQTDIITCLIFV